MTLLITTSHKPTRRVRTLCHDLQRVLPNSIRINRGKLNLQGVVEEALTQGADRLMLLDRWQGAPGKIQFYILKPGVEPFFPLIYLSSVRLQDELSGPFSTREKLIARAPKDGPNELIKLGTVLAGFLRIPLVTNEAEMEGFSVSLVFDIVASGIAVSFKRVLSNMEIGPRLIVRNLIWSDKNDSEA